MFAAHASGPHFGMVYADGPRMTKRRRPDAARIAQLQRYLEKRDLCWRNGEFEVGGSPGIRIAMEDVIVMAQYGESQGYGVEGGGRVVKERADKRAREIAAAVEQELADRRARKEREYGLVSRARRVVAKRSGLTETQVKKAHLRMTKTDRTTVR